MPRISHFDWLVAILPLLLSACAASRPLPCDASRSQGPAAWLIDQGWHTEIGLPARELSGPLAGFRRVFPGATVLMFGFGKRTWMTARVETPSELLMGPFPGPGAIQVVGLRVPPAEAYPAGEAIRLALRPEQLARLSDFVWNEIGKTRTGQARLISAGLFPGSLFYAARRGYGPGFTCNSWTAQALQSAGLPVSPRGVVFSGGVLEQAARLGAACRVEAAILPR